MTAPRRGACEKDLCGTIRRREAVVGEKLEDMSVYRQSAGEEDMRDQLQAGRHVGQGAKNVRLGGT